MRHHNRSLLILVLTANFVGAAGLAGGDMWEPPTSPCDVNNSGSTTIADVQSVINQALGGFTPQSGPVGTVVSVMGLNFGATPQVSMPNQAGGGNDRRNGDCEHEFRFHGDASQHIYTYGLLHRPH